MKNHSMILVGLSATFMLSTSIAMAQQTVNVAGYSGVFEEYFKEAVVAPFEAAHPDIKINYEPAFNSSQLVGQLVAQQADPQVDVVLMDLVASKGATDQSLFEQLDEALVPGVANLVDAARIGGVAGLPFTFDYPTIIYNPSLVDPVPTSWNVLGDAQYAGKVAVAAPPGLLGTTLVVIQDRNAGGTDPLVSLDKGIEAMAAIAPNVLSFESKDWYPSVANGEVAMAIGWNARAQIYADQTEGAVLSALPDDGLVRQINTVNLVANAKERDGALVFIDYLLGAEAQSAIAEQMHYTPTNSTVELSADAQKRTGSDKADTVIDMDWIAFAPLNATMTEQWRRRVTSN